MQLSPLSLDALETLGLTLTSRPGIWRAVVEPTDVGARVVLTARSKAVAIDALQIASAVAGVPFLFGDCIEGRRAIVTATYMSTLPAQQLVAILVSMPLIES